MATPKIIPYTVKLRSVVPEKTFSKPPVVYTNDLRSAEFQFKITDMDASELLTATAKTMLYMRDGSFFQNPSTDVSRVGNVFSYLLKENEGNHAGIAKIQLVVYFNEGLANEQNFPTQLYEFEIINGLETKVAQEVMIYDWTTLTREARAYIDEFTANEILREAEFDNNEFDRNMAFVASQDARTLAFGTEQTNRGTAFTAEQNERTTAFNESESGRTTAETGRVTAESNRVTAESGRVTKESQRVTAETNRVTAEGNRVTAESGRVTAESGRATTFAGYNARITGMEADTTMMGTNLVTNGDFSNGTNGWGVNGGTMTTANNEATVTSTSLGGSVGLYRAPVSGSGNKLYVSGEIYPKYGTLTSFGFNAGETISFYPTPNTWNRKSAVLKNNASSIVFYHQFSSSEYVITDTIRFSRLLTIDLTATFGKGNEPTAEQMDAILAKFPNSWFNGTANLFRANATLNKLMAVDARTEFEGKNVMLNGDFSNGMTGWIEGTPALNSITSGNLVFTNDGVVRTFVSKSVEGPIAVGDKLYFACRAKCNAGSGDVLFAATPQSSLGSLNITGYPVIAKTGQFAYASVIGTAAGTSYFFGVISGLGVISSAEIDYLQVINLTKTFGAGKEPTLAEMDRLMARFPNSWFDGTKPIQTIETLYQEKANKVQEAWITPTLLNGWIGNLQYRKNEFGNVEFRGGVNGGTVGTPITTIPAGYRPAINYLFMAMNGYNNTYATGYVTTVGNVQLNTKPSTADPVSMSNCFYSIV